MFWAEGKPFADSTVGWELQLEPHEDLLTGLGEWWYRILTEARMLSRHFEWSRLILRAERRTRPDARVGRLSASFANISERRCGPVIIDLAGEQFTRFIPDALPEELYDREELIWRLDLYSLARQAVQFGQLAPIYADWNAEHPVPVYGTVLDGLYDLRITGHAPGPLPAFDRQILHQQIAAGGNTEPAGDPQLLPYCQAVWEELSQAIPSHWPRATCWIRHVPGPGDGLVYHNISSPDFPGEDPLPSPRLNFALSTLVDAWVRQGVAFPDMLATVERQPDGTWQSDLHVVTS